MERFPHRMGVFLLAVAGGCTQPEDSIPNSEDTKRTEAEQKATTDEIGHALEASTDPDALSAEEIAAVTERVFGVAAELLDLVLRITDRGEDMENPSGTEGNTARAAFRLHFLLTELAPQVEGGIANREALNELQEQLVSLEGIVEEGEDAFSDLTGLTPYFEKMYGSIVGKLPAYDYSLPEKKVPQESESEATQH